MALTTNLCEQIYRTMTLVTNLCKQPNRKMTLATNPCEQPNRTMTLANILTPPSNTLLAIFLTRTTYDCQYGHTPVIADTF
jgi:hypothetical protein